MIPTILFFQAATLASQSWRDKLAGIYRYASEVGWQVQMVLTNSSATHIRETIRLYRPIGCIVDRCGSRARPPSILFRDIPVVLLDQNPRTANDSYMCITHDSTATATLAAKELLKTDLEHFTYAPVAKRYSWNLERQTAFARAMQSAGKHYFPWPSLPVSDALLTDFPLPCGILCANDQVAKAVLSRTAQLGLSVPDDVSVIGIDNDELICQHTHPPLTSILPDFEHAGYLAAQKLAEVIRHPQMRKAIFFYGPKAIYRRESSRRFPQTDPKVCRALEHIRIHAFEPTLHIADVAKAMGCARAYAERRFREITGRSILSEIQSQRMEKAYELLGKPQQSITSIPSLCGYRSEAFFKRLFKRTTGLTMREWRVQNHETGLSPQAWRRGLQGEKARTPQKLPRTPISKVRGSPAKHS